MNYQEYHTRALDKIASKELPATYKPMTENEFIEFGKPIQETPPLMQQRDFVLSYEIMYKRLKRILLNSNNPQKESMLKEIDEIYQEIAKKLNLL